MSIQNALATALVRDQKALGTAFARDQVQAPRAPSKKLVTATAPTSILQMNPLPMTLDPSLYANARPNNIPVGTSGNTPAFFSMEPEEQKPTRC